MCCVHSVVILIDIHYDFLHLNHWYFRGLTYRVSAALCCVVYWDVCLCIMQVGVICWFICSFDRTCMYQISFSFFFFYLNSTQIQSLSIIFKLHIKNFTCIVFEFYVYLKDY